MPVRCLAYLLDTPVEPGVVVTYRCTRPVGHAGDEHEDHDAGRTWTGDTGVVWAPGAVYPVHTGWPWDDSPPPQTSGTSVMPAIPGVPGAAAPTGQLNAVNGTVTGVPPIS